jgi:peptidoglycan/LPS O-acetylase OafA/YrhL
MTLLSRLFGPGLFRLFLASMVVVYHLSRFGIGPAAVYVFFTLSGYWITLMWVDRYSRTRQPYLTYIVSRMWRLLPVFLAVTAIQISLNLWLGATPDNLRASASWLRFVFSNLFIVGYATLPHQPLVPAWSLDLEMQFYMVAPLLVALVVGRTRPWLLLLPLGALSLISAHYFGAQVILTYLVFFLVGMVAAEMDWQPTGKVAALAAGTAVLLVGGLLLSVYRGIVLVGAHHTALAVYNLPLNACVGVLMIPLAIFTVRQKGFSCDSMFADLSYVVYLLHWTSFQILAATKFLPISRLASTALAVFTVYVVSWFIWKFFDRPLNRLRSNWVRTRLDTAEKATLSARVAQPGS